MTGLIITLDLKGAKMLGTIRPSNSTTPEEEGMLKAVAIRVVEEIQKSLMEDGINSNLVVNDKPEGP